MRLKNKVCVITGAASGMGRVACDLFAKEGAKIVALDVNAKDGETLTREAYDKGYLLQFQRCDVSQPAQVKKAIEAGVKRFGKLDVLYNNAGVFLKDDTSVVDTEPEVWDKTMDINLKGMYLVAKYGIPHLMANTKKGGSGSIINVASFVALLGCTVPQDAYTASKGGAIALTKSLAIQYGRNNIRANAICPGPIETPLLTKWLLANPKERDKRLVRQPMGRFGRPEDIVYGALYLASDESSWTNGIALVIDGGVTSNYF